MDKDIKKEIDKFISEIRDFKFFSKIEFIIQYGSSLTKYYVKESDIDVCVYIRENDADKLTELRLDLLKKFGNKLDIQIFKLLPLYVQIEVLKGKVLYVKEMSFLYEIANQTIEEYEDFYPLYSDYINNM